MTVAAASTVHPDEVHERLGRHVLTDGFKLVLDPLASQGSWIVDARTGEKFLDLYSFFASAPLGLNARGIVDDPEFMTLLAQVAANKPANPDIYTTHYAEFVETFARVLGDPELPRLFFVEGGALAVENALKAAFDWKSRRNEAAGRSPELGTQVLHLRRAFHGRSGYTLSLTNTEPGKTARFPRFDWPRIDVPAVRFPLEHHLAEVEEAERRALEQARRAFEDNLHDVACFIAEPIQGEGGDNHMRPEFLQAMQALCHEYDALFVLDEVQTGVGITGTTWAYQQLGLEPDIVAFAKKVQLGGVMAGRRVEQVPDNVFRVSGRINSTWGGGLVDMVRARRILEIIERDDLVANAAAVGAWFLAELRDLEVRHAPVVSNSRGRGLMSAVDLPDMGVRDEVIRRLRTEEQVIALPCGERSVRFRPALSITQGELEVALRALDRLLTGLH
ncbi:L-lysine 6-transaminase [Streptomyces cyaneochromogenes]|uniref:L-lysine-epsilon aminotransferase n=1 Tax=Streptomyces cyaneochromogenes TaxID=2496836 RepID=A0A3Q9EZ40_9ACTN|nr:L-lysine 6-transaminase [Streptomyces cyaneochromogenes]AZQ39022.1 L-lysine 6-transaminase [Streptomyces cyaneochromogenes]